MTIDARGNIYLTGKTVTVYNRKGEKIAEISVPEGPANVTFGGRNNQTLFITARTSLYSVPTEVRGARTPIRPGPQRTGREGKQRQKQK
jgi:gluconolactonase